MILLRLEFFLFSIINSFMSLKDRIEKLQSTASVETSKIDQGLRSYMLKVYNYMSSGILLTGIVALIIFKFAAVTDLSLIHI